MSRPPLHVVEPGEPPAETVAERIRRLQTEARLLAKDQVRALVALLAGTEGLAREIADGGGAYHDGAQERARRIAMELESQRQTLQAILERMP